MLVTASLDRSEAMDKLAAAHESAGDVERAESLYLRMLAWREGADQFQATDQWSQRCAVVMLQAELAATISHLEKIKR